MTIGDIVPLIFGLLVGGAAGYWATIRRRRQTIPHRLPARLEYRIYGQGLELDSAALLTEMRPMPHATGLVMSDVRLTLGRVRREGNAIAFRPDLLAPLHEPPDEAVRVFLAADSFLRMRWRAERPGDDASHARDFLGRAATVALALNPGAVCLDLTAERFVEPPARSELSVVWDSESTARTVGLLAWGMPEIVLEDLPHDARILMETILPLAAREYTTPGRDPAAAIEVEAFGDSFTIRPMTMRGEAVKCEVGRRRGA